MQTRISIPHHDYPARLRSQVEEKLQGLERFYDNVVSMSAKLERESEAHRIELVANVGHGAVLVADVKREAFGAALEEAVDRMTAQLKKHHDKIVAYRHGRR
jgi:ribosomal subunit interface protein